MIIFIRSEGHGSYENRELCPFSPSGTARRHQAIPARIADATRHLTLRGGVSVPLVVDSCCAYESCDGRQTETVQGSFQKDRRWAGRYRLLPQMGGTWLWP